MVRAEDAGSAVLGVFIEPVDSRCNNGPDTVSHKDVIQHQPGQRVEGVTPGWNSRGNAEAKSRSLEQSPGGLVSAAAEVEVRTQHRCVVLYHFEQMSCLLCPAGGAEPTVARRSTGIQMRADEAQADTAQLNRSGNGDTAL
jgi:hypothetical protein